MKQIRVDFVKKRTPPKMANAQGMGVHRDAIAVPGKVVAVSARLHAVDVELENGQVIFKSSVLSRQWVNDGGDAVTGKRDIPSVGSYVLVLFPEGRNNPDRTFVLGSFFLPVSDTPHTPFIGEGTEGEEYERSPAGWTETINRETGRIDIQHDGGIVVTVDPEAGLTVTDQHGNTVTTADSGLNIGDANGNTVGMASGGITIEDANGNQIFMDAAGVKLKTGDASTWLPNIIPACPFTGQPHGGPVAGIVKLTGG